MAGLSVSRLIRVAINLAPLAAQGANLNALLVMGSSDVIDVSERMRLYNDIASVGIDFGTSAPEYKAAALYFAQSPQPQALYVGRWAKTASAGLLRGGVLSALEQTLATWTAITSGGFSVTIDGAVKALTGLNFSGATNLNGVASVITTALGVAGSCTWDGSRFKITSATTGATSTVAYAVAPGAGTNISALLKLTSGLASPPVAGIVAETPDAAVASFLDRFSTQFFGLLFADSALTDAQHLAVAALIEADQRHIYGVSSSSTTLLDSTITTDIASVMAAAGYQQSFVQYSQIPYAAASMFGRAFSVDFNANRSTITLMYKQEPGVTYEVLTASQAATLKAKRANVFAFYTNSTAIIQDGVMSGPAFFDEIHGLAWLRNRIETDAFNLLYTSTTKIPQTDEGNHLIANTIEGALIAAGNNGLVGPGSWTSGGFGTLKPGDFLPKGYYLFTPTLASQAQSDREARKSVPFQIAVKLAGAVHSVDIAINVNR